MLDKPFTLEEAFAELDKQSLQESVPFSKEKGFPNEQEQENIVFNLAYDLPMQEFDVEWDNLISYLDDCPDSIDYHDIIVNVTTGYDRDYGYESEEREIDWSYRYNPSNWSDDVSDFFWKEVEERGLGDKSEFTLKEVLNIFNHDKMYEFLKKKYRKLAEEDAAINYDQDLDDRNYDDSYYDDWRA